MIFRRPVFRIILDCQFMRPLPTGQVGFVTVKFETAQSKEAAIEAAKARTRNMMAAKGLGGLLDEVSMVVEEVDLCQEDDIEKMSEQSFVYY